MKKSSLLLAMTGFLSIAPVYSLDFAFAAPNENNSQAANQQNDAVNDALAKIEAAAQTGDEQLVAKLLSEAIKNNPDSASQIIAAFTASPSAKTINVAAIVNNVVSSLQKQKGGEQLAAAVLSSYTPAAGGNNPNANNAPQTNIAQNNTNTPPANLPPALPAAGNIGSNANNALPQENPNQTSTR